MGQARQRQAEIAQLKSAGDNGRNFAINFKFNLVDDGDDQHKYNMLAVYTPKIIDSMRANDYDNDKCFEIISSEHSLNLLVVKAGNADMSDPKVEQQIQQSMRTVALAVLRMAILDPYKEVVIRPDTVLDMTLEEVDGRVGFNLIEGMPNSMLLAQKGVQRFVDEAKQHDVDFVLTLQ